MCKHIYQNVLPHSYKGLNKCPLPLLFEKGKEMVENGQLASSKYSQLSIDDEGKCAFHSQDKVFRIKSDTTRLFQTLIEILKIYDHSYTDEENDINLSEMQVGVSEKSKALTIDIDGFHVLNYELFFNYSIFYDEYKFVNPHFSYVSFANCKFLGGVQFFDGQLRGNFHRCTFGRNVTYEEVMFTDFVDFSYSKFYMGLTVHHCQFQKQAIFANCLFEENSVSQLVKFSAYFFEFADFTGSVFNIFVIFDYCKFDGEVNFTNASFRSRLFILKSSIASNFFLKGKSKEEPLFDDLVDMDIEKEEISGKIIFENASFFKINAAHKKILLELEKENKVEIGKGCIKYKLQTPEKKLDLSLDNQSIVLEFAQSFANYFYHSSGLSLGVEIKERTESYLIYFFYTDEVISEDEFFARLDNTEYEFLDLLFLSKEQHAKLPSRVDSVINRMDGFASLINVFIRVGARISFGKWNKSDTQKLLTSINRDNLEKMNHTQLHGLIKSKFNQTNIVNKYFLGDVVEKKIDRPFFYKGKHQFGNKIINKNKS